MAETKDATRRSTQTKPKPATQPDRQELPPYHVILLNDNDHTYEYVVGMLQSLFAHPSELAFKLAQQVDKSGRAIVFTTHKERAELKRDQISAFGNDPRVASSQGSMTALIQPAEA